MKVCKVCKQEKEPAQFNKRSSAKDGLQNYCKECNKDKLKLHYEAHKSDYKERDKLYREQVKNFIRDVKASKSCVGCGISDIACLDFHHIGDKTYEIADMVARGFSINSISKEMDKCVILCANCHRRLHYYSLTLEQLMPVCITA